MSASPSLPCSQPLLESNYRDEQLQDAFALEFYEKWNRVWRSQFSNPKLAPQVIGSEFLSENSPLSRLPQTGMGNI